MQYLSKDLKHAIYNFTTDDALKRLMCVSKSDNAIAAGVLAMRMKSAEAMFAEMLNKLREKYNEHCYFVKPDEIRVELVKNTDQWFKKWECELLIELRKPGSIKVSMKKYRIKGSVGIAWTKTFFPHAKSASICFEETRMHPYPSDPVAEVCKAFDSDDDSESSDESD